jgi:chemotaxis protein methyltransferase CheR
VELNRIEEIELQLLLEAIFLRYGYDFRSYARASIRRRVIKFMHSVGAQSIAEMIPGIIHDEPFFDDMVREFSITVTEMFRDPPLFLAMRQEVLPVLKSYPFIKVWHAGCATGEEAYSLAILMHEEEMAKRAMCFATDFNEAALAKARDGIYGLDKAQQFTQNYQLAGGTRSFSDYYHARYGAMAMDSMLKKNITFANHNLVSDHVFSEMHLIMCRNVLIYFSKELQERVFGLFHESLVTGGFLCLGSKESLLFSKVQGSFKEFDRQKRIFQKKY